MPLSLSYTLSHTYFKSGAQPCSPARDTPSHPATGGGAPAGLCRFAGAPGRWGQQKVAPPAGAQDYANIAGALLAVHQRVSSAGQASAVATEDLALPPDVAVTSAGCANCRTELDRSCFLIHFSQIGKRGCAMVTAPGRAGRGFGLGRALPWHGLTRPS